MAPSTSRSVWSAPACGRCRSTALLPETYCPTSASHRRHDFLRTRPHRPLEAPVPPRPGGWVYRRPRPEDRKAPLAELLPRAAAEVAGGRPKTQTRPRVGSFASRGCNSLSEQPFTFGRLVPVRAARTLKGNGFFVGFPVAGAQKVKCAGSGQRRGSPQLQLRRLAARRWPLLFPRQNTPPATVLTPRQAAVRSPLPVNRIACRAQLTPAGRRRSRAAAHPTALPFHKSALRTLADVADIDAPWAVAAVALGTENLPRLGRTCRGGWSTGAKCRTTSQASWCFAGCESNISPHAHESTGMDRDPGCVCLCGPLGCNPRFQFARPVRV